MAPTPLALPAPALTPAATRGLIDAVDSQIAALKASIRALRLERKTLKTHLDAYIYPVLTFPNEIISEIFLESLDSSKRSLSDPSSPLFLGHICRKWREIALSTPSLWTDIGLYLGNVAAHESQLRLLETWLRRSRECPLSISLHHNCEHSESVPTARGSVHEFVEAIMPHCRRFRALFLDVALCDLFLFKGELPLLSTLAISTEPLQSSQQPDPSWLVTLFDQAPEFRLEPVVILYIDDSRSIRYLNNDWNRITGHE
ncbi:hypothetical protein C8R44DRAFT_910890 [Mycena epipterygia]|nr:hypothetical protein C8R44DRAFT_910890 [Mycena epipterygia]